MNILSGKTLLQQSVEAASGGNVTVMYDDKDLPCFMRRISAFNLEDIDPSLGTGLHPAFIVNGVAKSEIWIGQYHASVHAGRALSLPSQNMLASATYDEAITYCKNKGQGWHLMTNAEWAAIMLWCYKNGTVPRGNTYSGRNEESGWKHETGVRKDGIEPGTGGGDPKTLTGSGPVTWRHDLTTAGIADLVGNVWDYTAGLAIVDGEIRVMPDNNAAYQSPNTYVDAEAGWRAFLQDGSLTDMLGQTDTTLKYDSLAAASEDGVITCVGSPEINTAILYPHNSSPETDEDYSFDSFKNLTCNSNLTAGLPSSLIKLGLAPLAAHSPKGGLWIRNNGIRMATRGGSFYNTSASGLGALHFWLRSRTSYGSWNIGFRPAFVS